MEEAAPARQFVIVLRGESAARFRPEKGPLQILKVGSPVGPIDIVFDTRYSDEGLEDPIPREMIAEARLTATCTLEEAINAALGVGNMLVPWFAISTNAPIGDLDVHLAFDSTPRATEHPFFENFLPDERGRPRHGRHVPAPETIAVMNAAGARPEFFERLHRATSQYREA